MPTSFTQLELRNILPDTDEAYIAYDADDGFRLFKEIEDGTAIYYKDITLASPPSELFQFHGNATVTNDNVVTLNNVVILNANQTVNGGIYTISKIGSTNFTSIGAEDNIPNIIFTATGAGSGSGKVVSNTIEDQDIVAGRLYKILTLGTTDWNTVAGTTGVTYAAGDWFVAAAAGSGSGTVVSNFSYLDNKVGQIIKVGNTWAVINDYIDERTVVVDRKVSSGTVYIPRYYPDVLLDTIIGKATVELSGATIDIEDAVQGKQYIIVFPGNTTFTSLGAANNNAGTIFTKNATAGTGTGTVCPAYVVPTQTAFNVTTIKVDKYYEITTLGNTSNTVWNSIASTTGVTYAAGDIIKAVNSTVATGTGTVKRAYPAKPIIVGKTYQIVTVGSTNFVAAGASANTVGVEFTTTAEPLGGSGTVSSYNIERYFTSITDFSQGSVAKSGTYIGEPRLDGAGLLYTWSGTAWIPANTTASEVVVSATAPSSPASGTLWFRTSDSRMFLWNGTVWIQSIPGVSGSRTIDTTTIDGLYDNETVIDSTDGNLYRWDQATDSWILVAETTTVDLTNQAHVCPANNDGTSVNFTGASTQIKVYSGGSDVSSQWTISKAETNVTGTIAPGSPPYSLPYTYNVTGLSADSGFVDFTLSKTNQADRVVRFSVSKAKAGEDGAATVYRINSSVSSVRYDSVNYQPTSIDFNAIIVDGTSAPAAYAGRFKISYSTNGTTYTDSYTSASDESSKNYSIPAVNNIKFIKVQLYQAGGTTILRDEETLPVLVDGTDGISGYLTNENHTVSTNSSGLDYSLTSAGGTFNVLKGTQNVTTSSTFSIVGGTDGGATWTKVQNGLTFTIDETTGVYSLSGTSWTSNVETFTATAVYSGVSISKIYTISKSKSGIDGADGADGTDGINARSVNLTVSGAGTFTYDSSGNNPTPANLTITANALNTAGTVYYEFFVNDVSQANTTTNTYVLTAPVSISNRKIEVQIREGSTTGSVLARDQITIAGLRPGADSQYVVVNGEQAFKFAPNATVPTNNTITLTASLFGGLTTYDWEYWTGSAWANLSGTNTNSTYSLAYDNAAWGANNSLRIRCLSGSAFDEITVVKLYDGSNSVVGYLTNENHTVATNSAGGSYSLTNAGGTFNVFNGLTNVTTSSTFSIVDGTDGGATWTKVQNGLTFTIDETTGVYSLSGTSWTTDIENFTITATFNSIVITKVYTISKAKGGVSTINAILSNEAHTLPTTNTGSVTYTGSGTTLRVFEGSTQLTYANSGNGTFTVSAAGTNITPSSPTGLNTTTATYPDHSAMTQNSASITFTITVTSSTGATSTITKTQSFAKSIQGADGSGADAQYVIVTGEQAFKYLAGQSVPTNSTITLTAELFGGLTTFAWEYYTTSWVSAPGTNNTSTYIVDSSNATVWPSNVTLRRFRCVSNSGKFDEITIVRLYDGSNTINALLTNEAHVLPADNSGNVTSYTGSGTTIRVYEGSTELTYAASGNGTFSATAAVTSGTITIGTQTNGTFAAHSAMTTDTAAITYTITVRSSTGVTSTITKVQSLSKARAGAAGSNGIDGRVVTLTTGSQVFAYNSDGKLPTPSNTTLTATALNTSGTVYYEFFLNDVSQVNTTTNTYTLTAPTDIANSKIEVRIRENSTTNPVLARDQLTVIGVRPGANSINAILTNEAHTLSTTNTGAVTYTGSGTAIRVYEGSTELTYATSGNGTFSATAAVTSGTITIGTQTNATFADHSAMTTDTAAITYTITVRSSTGIVSTVTKIQSLAKSIQGADGSGADAEYVIVTGEQAFKFLAGQTVPTSASITLTAVLTAGITTYDWEYWTGTNWTNLSGINSNSTYSLAYNNAAWGSLTVLRVRCVSNGGRFDEITIVKLYDGSNTINALLTNEAHVLPQTSEGVVTYTGSGTTIRVYEGSTELTYAASGNGTFSATAAVTSGTITIGTQTNGTFAAHSAMTTDTAAITYTITVRSSTGVTSTITKVQSLAKAIQGITGINSATVSLFAKNTSAVSPPAAFSGTFTYTFSSGALSGGTLNGWSTIAPSLSTGEYLWVRTIVASSNTASVNLNSADFSAANVVGIGGTNGTNGTNGTRTAILDMYQWASTAPTQFPTGTASTYTWATGQFTAPGTPNGWSLTPGTPSPGQTLYIARQVYSDTSTSATSSVSWTTNTAISVGVAGNNGQRVGYLEVYIWSATTPTQFPSGNSTYTWATGAFTAPSTPNGWSLTPGAAVLGQTLWGISVYVSNNNTTATDSVAWNSSTPYPVGYAGSNGTNGTNTARVALFAKNTSPSTPPTSFSGTFTYTFNPPGLSGGTLGVWSETAPSITNGEYLWARFAIASSNTNTDTIADTEFSAASIASIGGINGTNGINTFTISLFAKNSSPTIPPSSFTGPFTYTFSTNSLSGGNLNGWSETAPGITNGEYLWVRRAVAASNTDTDSVPESDFSAAVVTSVAGTNGTNGTNGLRGPGTWYIDVDGVDYVSGTDGRLPLTSADAAEAWAEGVFTGTSPGTPVGNDQAWFYKGTQANPTSQSVWIYDGTNWNQQNEVIDGNLLVTGTITTSKIGVGQVTAEKIQVGSLSAITATIGTLRTATTGARVEIKDNIIEVYDATRLRVRLGIWT